MFSLCIGISLYFLISWLFWMGTHWRHWKALSSLSTLAVSNGRGGREGGFISFTRVNLKIWAHWPFDALLHRRSFRITYERPNKPAVCTHINVLSRQWFRTQQWWHSFTKNFIPQKIIQLKVEWHICLWYQLVGVQCNYHSSYTLIAFTKGSVEHLLLSAIYHMVDRFHEMCRFKF